MNPDVRESLVRELVLAELASGKGDERQRRAWQEMEWRKCAASCQYFLDNYGYIIDAGEVRKWEMWPVQRLLVQLLQTKLEEAHATHESGGVVAVKSRQLGITTVTGHFDLWDIVFHDASRWDLFAHSGDKGKEILERVQATKDRLPRWMVERAESRSRIETEEYTRRNKKADSVTKIQYGFSQMKIATSTFKNIQGATANIVLDEFTLHEEKARKLRQTHATIDGASGIAVIIANGDGEDTFFHLCRKVAPKDFGLPKGKGLHNWDFFFFWWGDAPYRLKDAFVTIDNQRIPADKFTREELMDHAAQGRLDSPWYTREMEKFLIEKPEADAYAFKAVYPTTIQEAFYLTGNSRFKLSILNEYSQNLRERNVRPQYGILEHDCAQPFELRSNGPWRLYEPPQQGAKYVFGIDPSGGSEAGDYATCQVLKILPMVRAEQVAVLQAKLEQSELAHEVLKAARWYNEAYLVPEANYGHLLIGILKGEYYNLYLRKSRQERFTETSSDSIGFWTDGGSKLHVVGQLADWLNTGRIKLNDAQTLHELQHYEYLGDGSSLKTGAPKGMNDDLVMGLAVAIEGVIDAESFHVGAQPRVLMPWE